MKKILIVYATAGIGHKKASIAVKKAFDEMRPKDVETVLADALDYAPPFFKRTYLDLYLTAVNKFSFTWGLMYYITDNFFVNLIVKQLRRFNNWLNSKRFVEYLLKENFDVIISTHFFASEVAGVLKKRGALKSKLMTVVTDYRLHSWWVAPSVDMYVVSNEDAKADLLRWKIDPDRIKVLGIPVEPVFSKHLDKEPLKEKLGLRKDLFTVLVIGGGFGVGPIEDIVRSLGSVSRPVQLIVICGHNEELAKRVGSMEVNKDVTVKAVGFVDNVYEFMEVSDILISKSGGITVSESLAKELPMIVIAPIPGQETRNSDFLIRHGAAVKVAKSSDIRGVIEYLISDPSKIAQMKEAIRKIRTPESSYNIAKAALDMAEGAR